MSRLRKFIERRNVLYKKHTVLIIVSCFATMLLTLSFKLFFLYLIPAAVLVGFVGLCMYFDGKREKEAMYERLEDSLRQRAMKEMRDSYVNAVMNEQYPAPRGFSGRYEMPPAYNSFRYKVIDHFDANPGKCIAEMQVEYCKVNVHIPNSLIAYMNSKEREEYDKYMNEHRGEVKAKDVGIL